MWYVNVSNLYTSVTQIIFLFNHQNHKNLLNFKKIRSATELSNGLYPHYQYTVVMFISIILTFCLDDELRFGKQEVAESGTNKIKKKN